MKLLIPLVIVLSMTGCKSFDADKASVSLGLGYQINIEDEDGTNPLGILELEYEFTDNINCSYLHVSHISEGAPFNNKQEDTLDSLGCAYKFNVGDLLK